MASNNASRAALSPTTISSPGNRRSRRDSTTSTSAGSQFDKEQLAQALDKIHTSASQSGILTTFNDFGPPPGGAPPAESKGTAGDIVQQGLSGLYSRFKEAVGAVGKGAAADTEEPDSQDAASRKSVNSGHTASKASISSLARGESVATASTSNVNPQGDTPTSAMSSSGTLTTDGRLQSSKPPSISMGGSKSTSSSTQNLPRMAKTAVPSIVDPAVAPITVSAFRENELGRGTTLRTAESRSHSRRSTGKLPEISQSAIATGKPTVYDVTARRNPSNGERVNIPNRPGRDETMSHDGSLDMPLSPVDGTMSATASLHTTGSGQRLSSRETLRKPAVIDRISQSGSSGQLRSRSSSMDPGTAEPSPIIMSAHSSVYHESFTHDEKPEQLRSGAMRITGTTTNEGAPEMVNARLEVMRKQVLSKEFWMADETCKECFLCGDPFSAFRRKHHCRTCGCIFDSKCTSIIPGQKFGVSGTLRVCKTCLNIINRRYDSGSDDSGEEESYLPAIFRSKPLKPAQLASKSRGDDELSLSERVEEIDDNRSITTPMMAIPATRRIGDANRHSAVLEIDAPQLSRPSSSRSLRSLAGRPQSSGHKRHHSKHNFLGRFKPAPEETAPFRKSADEELRKKSKLPAFHDDNIIDPELAAYMSEESSGDEQMSIFATMASSDIVPSSLDPEKSNFGPFLSAGRKHRLRQGEKSVSGLSFTSRGADDFNLPPIINHGRPSRRRNLSTTSASGHHLRSPRPKSAAFKGLPTANDTLSLFDNTSAIEATRLTRSDSIRDEKPPETELSPPSLAHVKKLLRQLLQEADIPNTPAWEKALVPILIRCPNDLDPDAQRGDVMDVRHYVKLKRIPGGKPGDTSYVSGVIFTKNLALKSMPRRILNPRIIIVSFPIEYQRQQQQHFMSLQPVIEQEKEFLRVVVNRIVSLRPQVLLCEKSVAGVALQFLSEAGIAVVYNVKQAVVEAVSRCAETEVISSLDMLALKIPVGQAGGFEVKTYVNNDFPGRKKTYIFISGCNEKLGCTIALRGATTNLLSRLKTITEFMVYVVYNLKLESCLLRDQWINVPTTLDGTSTPSTLTQPTEDSSGSIHNSDHGEAPEGSMQSSQASDGEKLTQATNETSSSPDESQSHDKTSLTSIGRSKTLVSLHESHSKASHDTQVPEDVPMPTFYSDMVAKYETKILSASPFVKFTQPYLLMKSREQERRLVYLKRLRDQDIFEDQGENENSKPQSFQLIKPEMVHEIGQKAPRQIMEVLHAVHDAEYDKALYNYQTQTRQWENYIQGNLDLFDPYSHQNIVVLYSVICTETKIPCSEPSLIAIGFYQEGPTDSMDPDITLGQYIEDLCDTAENICHANGCDSQMCQHHRTYVHDEARITIFVEKNAPIPIPVDDTKAEEIYMWSYCKECKRDMGLMVMSDATWKYSFGKYLELSFWSRGLKMHHEMNCTHDYQKEHIRYFWHGGTSVRLHYDPIDLLEIIVPRARITWKVDHDLKLKNEIFTKSEDRWNRYMNSVKARLKSIRIDSVLPEKADACKTEVERLTKKAQEDQASLIHDLQSAYMNSKYYEVIPLNAIIRGMLEKVADWDSAFTKFEADFLSDKDVRQLTIIQLKKMFTDNESKESLPTTTTDGTSITSTDTEDKTTPQTTQTSVSEHDEKIPTQSSEGEAGLVPMPIITTGDDTLSSPSKTLVGEPLSERVEPLDLATPSSPSLLKSGIVPPDPNKTSSSDATVAPSPLLLPTTQPSVAPPPLNTSLSLTEKVEQLRRQHHAMTAELGNVVPNMEEPPRAIPERGSSRRAGLNVSPPMVRAISTPAGTLPRTHSSLGKPLLAKESKLPEPGELHRIPTNESSKSDKKLSERFGLGALKTKKPGQSSIPRYVHAKKRESKVSTLARHFEQLSREFEKERLRDRKQRAAKMHNSRAFLPRTSTKAIVEVYEDVDQAVQELGPSDDDPKPSAATTTTESGETTTVDASGTQTTNTATSTEPPSQAEDGVETDDQKHESHVGSDDEGGGSDADQSLLEEILPGVQEIAESLESSEEIPLELPKHQKSSLMKMLSNFWAERSASGWPQLEYPLNATDHIFIDSDVIVREDEPSSLIAFALSSEDYQAKLADIRHQWKLSNQRDIEDGADGETKSIAYSESGDGFFNEEELEKSLLRSTGTHLKYQFVEGSAKMLCKIFYAEQFDALRRKCGVADRIIESLSRCLKWDSKGGKTKSVFLKTLDDRLVMKSLSPIETAAFLRFAPAYFSIMSEALFHDLPSVIAKMVGFFQVSIKNPVTNTEIKLDLLVMENLFYDRSPNRIFDLKGSMRNRKIQSTGEQNEVLLDENMVEYIYESPLFAREHSKKLLRASVWNDTLFLARQNVMDYSLMIAVDEAKKELVVGIIDCIRTYTWDKRLESWIKDRGFAGGGRNRPTVTSPKEYKSRFREAMARYILQAPNCWHQFGAPQGAVTRARFEET